MTDDERELVVNEVTENDKSSSVEKKALNRMVAEGYRYQALNHKGESGILDPVGDEEAKAQQQRWLKVKILMIVGVILIACLVVVIIFQHVRYEKDYHVCTTATCVKDAAFILNKMDASTNPCEDFYTFSCGNWDRTVKIPPSKSKYGAFTEIDEDIGLILRQLLEEADKPYRGENSTATHKAKAYYKMCMDIAKIQTAGIQPALKLIRALGTWDFTSDVTSGKFDEDIWDVGDVLHIPHSYSFTPFFTVALSTDEKNNSQYLMKFEQSGLTLGDSKEYFPNHTNHAELKSAYMQYVTNFVTLLGATGDVAKKVEDLYNFEQELALIRVPKEQLIDAASYYHNMSLQDFQHTYLGNWLNLTNYMDSLFRNIAAVTMDTQVVVYTPDYFTKLRSLIKKTDDQTLANYMVWISIQNMGGYLSNEFAETALKLDKVESGVAELAPRWQRCLSKTNSALGFATGALYVEQYFQENSKTDVEAVFEDIRKAFISNLDNLDWMDETTKAYAAEKANAISKMLGYPDFITHPDELDQHFENLTLTEGQFFESRLAILKFYKKKNLRRIGTTPDKTEWDMIPSEVNGYYSPEFNQIAFPAGILRPPLYNPTVPKSFNFGSFGMICGHELTHGFDNKGRVFDKDGNMRDWWTKSSSDNFKEKSKCFEDYYSSYTVNGTHLNGQTTLAENIADNGGMKMAYLAYQSWKRRSGNVETPVLPGVQYSSDQLFFIGMAQIWCSHYTPEYMQQAILTDEHSISKYRVLGPISNSKEFAAAFSCPKNSPMNPEEKCTVW